MPLVDVTLSEGRSDAQVRALMHAVHAAVRDTIGARDEHIRVIVREVPRTRWATGDVTVAEMGLPTTPTHQTATEQESS